MEDHVVQAAIVVDRLFPPDNVSDTFRILASLNLLNTAVKKPWGKTLVNYSYIKGMAARLFTHLCHHPLKNVHIYHDQVLQVTFFRVFGVQISFHYLPNYSELPGQQKQAETEPQVWDGIRLQEIPVELFHIALPEGVDYSRNEARQACLRMMQHGMPAIPIRQPDYQETAAHPDPSATKSRKRVYNTCVFSENKLVSLRHALNFNIWSSTQFMLFRRKDHRFLYMMRYDGNNYAMLMKKLIGRHPLIQQRKEHTLEVGKFYHVSPLMKICSVPPSRYMLFLTRNCYLVHEGNYSNLCLTYNMALYLASLHPELMFANTLQYNRILNERKFYAYSQLCRVPLGADERRLKVWVPVDTTHLLCGFKPEDLPKPLIDEYLEAEDFYLEFQLLRCEGLLGIVAYRRYLLLPPIYKRICIRNYYAHVMRPDGKWAIYSLNLEKFVCDFIYDHIWYDRNNYTIYGDIGTQTTVIFSFLSE